MNLDAKIFIAGHRGLVGSAILRALQARGFRHLICRTHAELDLADARSTDEFFDAEQPHYVFLAAARVGGIAANDNCPADFIVDNLAIEMNVIRASQRTGVNRLLFLGSNCIYPKFANQPIGEESLLTGALEETNRPYALAKIAGIEMCWALNRQHKTKFLAAMPVNLYGPGDNYHALNSHVLPALIRRFHEARQAGLSSVTVWGSGTPRREFMYSDDLADACLHLMALDDARWMPLLGQDRNHGCAPVVMTGWKIAYAGHALCRHSHNYSMVQEFERYFDMGVFHARESWIRQHFGGAGGEGMRYLKSELKFLGWRGLYFWPGAILRNVLKLLGYKLGRQEARLSVGIKRKLGMHKRYWDGPFARTDCA